MNENANHLLPRHLAIIMDGNGRWAQRQKMPRVGGHEAGVQGVRETTTECAKLGIPYLTLYAFSSENWKRPKLEVAFLMRLLERYLVEERDDLMENNIQLTSIGRIEELPSGALKKLRETEEMTKNNRGMQLCLALSYGGRTEIADAVRKIAAEAAAGRIDPALIDENLVRSYFYDPNLPDPDLMIRTAGEMRLSNFLLWQSSYTELYVTPLCWPDFRKEHLYEALDSFRTRERKFGGLVPFGA